MNFLKRLLSLAAFSILLFCIETKAASFLYGINDNAAGNQIYGFSVDETTGALTALANFPVATGFNGGGSTNLEMITIDKLNKRLYVVNRGSNNISAYSVNDATGALTALPFSPITGIVNERVVKVHPSGSPLIVGGDDVASFVITATSATPAAGSPYPAGTNVQPLGATFSRDGNYFYTGGNLGNFYAGFAVNSSTGVLTTLAGSPYDSGNQTPNPTTTDASGRLFVINSRQAQTRVYTTASGVPTQVTGSPFANGLSSFASKGEIHPNGNFLMLGDRTGNRVGVYQISGAGAATTLTAVTGSPFATGGTSSLTLTFNESGGFLFVGNGTSRNISTFTVNAATGELSNRVVQAANTLGAAGIINGIAYVNFSANIVHDAPVDFNGDGKSDFAVTRNVNGASTWFINYNGSGNNLSQAVQFGSSVGTNGGDVAVPEDFDGDGKDDIAVWRGNVNNRAYFYILRSGDSTFQAIQFGSPNDDPTVVGDYDGDGKADVAVFRNNGLQSVAPCANSTVWYYRPSATTGVDFKYVCWGANGDRIAPGDYDGDGKNDFAVFRAQEGIFYVSKSGGGTDAVYWGANGDQTIPGDYDGDGKTDYAVARQQTPREFYIRTQTGATQFYQFGINTDVPVPGDYNGDGKTDIAVWRQASDSMSRVFYVRPSGTSGASDFAVQWGQQGDLPAAQYNLH